MVFPLVPIAAIAGLLGSGGVLAWYGSLNPRQRECADRKANEIASNMFGTALDRLASDEAKEVVSEVRKVIGT